ncbi:DevR family CRISPR-associated autoregulator [Thermogemmatispora sp.]|uniref:DevR family CRISPR-associated autoregulator n=1 Tax=Thermogemmatispora sp. TaxID=1968838 RepID=UPI002ACC31C2|nr:DevR family CRISPR-associated autoregulator [Thermogemmatispora sp.]
MANTPVSLSIAARMTLNMHSLNNEGGEGNQIQTRMVDIIGDDGLLHTVNAISGDMLKHVLMEHFYRRAREEGLSLCAGCQQFDANRINADSDFIKGAGDTGAALIDGLLQRCAMDDVGGILVTEGGRSVPRKSVCEFGWVVALPERVRTDSYFHVKYALERGPGAARKEESNEHKGANLGQSIFHRPASSGVYAVVCHVELSRVGYNDIAQRYAISAEERQRRTRVLLESLLYSFLEFNGAMRSTQLPHLLALEGFISTSDTATPAPLVSPLLGGSDEPQAYREQAEAIVRALNGAGPQHVRLQTFDTLAEFSQQMRSLIDSITPEAASA